MKCLLCSTDFLCIKFRNNEVPFGSSQEGYNNQITFQFNKINNNNNNNNAIRIYNVTINKSVVSLLTR